MAFNISYLSLTRTHQPQIVQRLLIKHARKQLKRTCKIFREISKRNMCHPKCLGDSDLNAKLRDFCRKTIFPPIVFAVFPRCQRCQPTHTFRTCSILILRHIRLCFKFNCLSVSLSVCPSVHRLFVPSSDATQIDRWKIYWQLARDSRNMLCLILSHKVNVKML